MTPDLAFTICNLGVLPAWLLLAFAPNWRYTDRLVHALWIPVLLGSVYLIALVVGPEPAEGAGFSSLAGVMLIFTSPISVLAGWVHYLAFDLFVGAWQVRDAKRRGLSHWLVVPCLLATLMFGPLGLTAYLILRMAMARVWRLEELV